jgi:putative membrane protein
VKSFVRLLQWILKAAVFFVLLVFALNNREDVAVHFFWGLQWQAPLVLILLSVFTLGVAVGVLGMVPRWWRQRRLAKKAQALPTPTGPDKPVNPPVAPDMYGP